MDFLTLFAIYVVVVLTCIALVCKYSGQQQTPFGLLFDSVTKVIAPWTPLWLQSFTQRTLHMLFHQRNRMFIYLHILLEGAVYTEFTYEVFGYCRDMDTTLSSLSVPYVLLVVKSCFFYLCITREPGTVTKKRHSGQLQVYPYDKRMFQPGVCCPTCQLVKPARSKHCRVCNRCVQRFDHHCVWVNNCIGAQNTRYFLLYLLSVCAMAADMALLTVDMLLHAVVRSGILQARYIDDDGQQQQAGMLFVIQHLFLTFPRIVFMLGFLVFVFLLLAGYAMFHFYLALVNQTSNEWYKGRGNVCQHCHPSPDHLCGLPASDQSKRWFYSRGVLRNLGEIFFPLRPVQKKDH
ncbi:palmitoyltransferase ZDHHC4 isoform X1 [Salmo salar]|uniref:Palmitoyltransferase n=2 Tax=Salmo salar TaxID=8030 RepID=B5X5Y6_SALSA|nr:palmitoyltransferase ZDHHC4 [Salmo salar]XP_014034354.1 palmitoyltransferase ZDHHC4 isoform X1 [Salmo salar]ACI66256.1 Probable palmitoyltransferase ZDHHC4 [Salmo salar]|eukprot:NP_001134110.1 probable palmitoyltransferase ZDHHC4 [Salmo salar]